MKFFTLNVLFSLLLLNINFVHSEEIQKSKIENNIPSDLTPSFLSCADSINIVGASAGDFNSHRYFSSLLTSALEATKHEYGTYNLNHVSLPIVQSRIIEIMKDSKDISVFWTVTSKERETQLIPIRVPLLRGLFGYRVSLISNKNYKEIEKLNDVEGFKNLLGGFGHDWPDLQIYQKNGFRVIGMSQYDNLIRLVKASRIDYVSRGIAEVVNELDGLQDPKLTVEPNFLFYYPSYVFFFVSPHCKGLAERLEAGLAIINRNGEMEKYFSQYVDLKTIKERLNLEKRQLIRIHNPLLSTKSKQLDNYEKLAFHP